MTTAQEWLELYARDPHEFAVEVAKVATTKPWKHKLSPMPGGMWKCQRCGMEIYDNKCAAWQPSISGECIPDPLALDWNTAIPLARQHEDIEDYMMEVYAARMDVDGIIGFAGVDYFALAAEAWEWIIAAILAKQAGKGE